MPDPAWALPLLLSVLVTGCDSSSLYTADLGQVGQLPAVMALTPAPPAGLQGKIVEFVASADGTLPAQWISARSLKVDLAGTFVPLVGGSVGASPSFNALVPATLGFVAPTGGSSESLAFEVDGDHVMLAEVTF